MMHDCWVGGTYYLGADGKMLVNTRTPDGYFVGADGAWVRETDNYTPYMNNTLRYVSPNLVRDFGNYYSYNGKLVRELFSSNPVRDCGDYLELNTPAAYRSGGFLLPRCSLFPATCRRRQRLLAPQAFSVRTVPALPTFIF